MNRVLIIIPAYNEEENISRVCSLLEEYRGNLNEQSPYSLDYIVINDGSSDKTEQICRENGFPIISLARNLGIGGAVQTGYLYARKMGYDVAVQFDGDGQHDIYSLEKIVLPVLAGETDLAIGSRFVGDSQDNFQSTFMRRVGIRFLSCMIYLFSGVHIKDCTSGYRAANKKVIAVFASDYPADYPEPESIVSLSKKNLRSMEVPVRMYEREGGRSSIRAFKSIYYMIKVSLAIVIAGVQKKEGV